MTPPVSPCGPLCASVAGEAESLLFPAGLRQREPVMGGIATQGFRPFWSGTEGRKEKQDKRRGRRRPLPAFSPSPCVWHQVFET